MEAKPKAASAWLVMLSAAAILMITMGARQSTGLFIAPIDESTGLGIVSISLALAVGQFVWGLVQPIFGAIADKKGSFHVIVFGAFLLASGLALTTLVQSEWSLMLTLGVLTAAGAGAGSFSVLIGSSAQQLDPKRRAFAGGFINAGGSFGQFLFAPLSQAIISAFGWVAAMATMAATTLLTIPLAVLLCRGASPNKTGASGQVSEGLFYQVRQAMGNTSYLCLHGVSRGGVKGTGLLTHFRQSYLCPANNAPVNPC
ncbi:MAG: MFS transporter [Syntrophomonadaceae bacterium]|nr:MFS transporter [Syntrophomonadaceae bacterium]